MDISNGGVKLLHNDIIEETDFAPIAIVHQKVSLEENSNILVGDGEVILPKAHCGKGFSLNVEQYVAKGKSGEDDAFCYVANGKTYDFKCKYYYEKPLDDSEEKTERVYLQKGQISVAVDGKLTYEIEGKIYDVKEEQTSENGWKLSTTLTDFKGVENLEQRSEEIAQIEEQNKQFNEALASTEQNIEGLNLSIAQMHESFNDAANLIASKKQIEDNLVVLKNKAKGIVDNYNYAFKEDAFESNSITNQTEIIQIQRDVTTGKEEKDIAQREVLDKQELICFEQENLLNEKKKLYGEFVVFYFDTSKLYINLNVAGKNFQISTELLSYKYETNSYVVLNEYVVHNLYELSIQYESIVREIEALANRLKYYKLQDESYATADSAENFADMLANLDNKGKYDFNIFSQYRNLTERLDILEREKQSYLTSIAKNNVYLAKYKDKTPTLFIKGDSPEVLCFTPISENLYVLTDIARTGKKIAF